MPLDPLNKTNNTLQDWYVNFIEQLPDILTAVFIFTISYAIALAARRSLEIAFRTVTKKRPLQRLAALLVQMVIIGIGILLALQVLDLDRTIISLLTGLGIVGFALGFAFKDIAANIIAGIMISITAPFKVRDIIKVTDYFGRIESIDLRNTTIKAFDGRLIHVPNKNMYDNPVINYTENGIRRIEITLGVSYDADLHKTKKVVTEVLEKSTFVYKKHKVQVSFYEFGDSSINFRVFFWVNYNEQFEFLDNKSDAIIAIKEAMDKAGLDIPFPIRTLIHTNSAPKKK